ncbi:MAG: hypothetical protein IPN69_02750 [Acidobacteria bacterium]|nr:hypothetical protein [Acidobacteriota bacterium]MBK8809633.1 hypothetical protein [Acidobacteriota bacterium]
MVTLFDEMTALTKAFDAAGIEYGLCGGLAMAVHGFSRATIDIDFLILADSLEESYDVAAKLGFDIRGLDMSFKERAVEIRRVSKIDDEGEVLSLDLLLVTPHVRDVWDSRITMDLAGNRYSIVSRDGLIKMKTLAGRSQDLADLERLQNESN